jgi:hypothetical protein
MNARYRINEKVLVCIYTFSRGDFIAEPQLSRVLKLSTFFIHVTPQCVGCMILVL